MPACLQGIQGAIDLGIGPVIVETDSTMLKREIYSHEFDQS